MRVKALEKSYNSVAEDLRCLALQSDGFENQQKILSKSMRKLERNLEDMADNFHRTQSEMMKGQPQNKSVDETVVTKLRSTIFDVQEQQSKFQNQLDMMTQDSKNKGKQIDVIVVDIKNLQVLCSFFSFFEDSSLLEVFENLGVLISFSFTL